MRDAIVVWLQTKGAKQVIVRKCMAYTASIFFQFVLNIGGPYAGPAKLKIDFM